MHLHSLACKNKTENDTRLLKNSKGNHDGERNFRREKEADNCFILASDKNKKLDQKTTLKQTSQ